MNILGRGSKCNACDKVLVPSVAACTCEPANIASHHSEDTALMMTQGFLVKTLEKVEFFTAGEISKLLQNGERIYGMDGMPLWEEFF